jgi:hypothetical protein
MMGLDQGMLLCGPVMIGTQGRRRVEKILRFDKTRCLEIWRLKSGSERNKYTQG